MKITLALFLTAAVAFAMAQTDRFTELRLNIDSFWLVRPTLVEALDEGWVPVNIHNPLDLTAVAITPKDFGINPLYDDQGFLAGIHLVQPTADVDDRESEISNSLVRRELNTIKSILQLTSTFLTVNPEILEAEDLTELSDRLDQDLRLRDNNSDNDYWQIPTDISQLSSTSRYNWQLCIPDVDQHYYYYVGNCSELFPWAVTVRSDSVTGFGWQIFSNQTVYDRNWFDEVPGQSLNLPNANATNCLALYTNSENGISAIHFYFLYEPSSIKCDQISAIAAPLR